MTSIWAEPGPCEVCEAVLRSGQGPGRGGLGPPPSGVFHAGGRGLEKPLLRGKGRLGEGPEGVLVR